MKQLNLFDQGLNLKPYSYPERLALLLGQDLDFTGKNHNHEWHNAHAFPAKFPPQLPAVFIEQLTDDGDVVLDPMAGSGTTVFEAYLSGRTAIGFDIDPLALLLTKVKTSTYDKRGVWSTYKKIMNTAQDWLKQSPLICREMLRQRYDEKTMQFFDYWFLPETQIELFALVYAIERSCDLEYRALFQTIFSSIIITKSGGVSLALDLAHTRPHKARAVVRPDGTAVYGNEILQDPAKKRSFHVKRLRSVLEEFEKKCIVSFRQLTCTEAGQIRPLVSMANAQNLPLRDNSVDLIVTSPPYASNAIDYMRAHKFSLSWFGYPLETLSKIREDTIGGEATKNFPYQILPETAARIVDKISGLDSKKGAVLHRYYSEMTMVLREMYRVLKSEKAAIVVVGSSILRGIDTQTHQCLAEIGKRIGFIPVGIGIRRIDRNRRMMPVGHQVDRDSQIQQRMHEEYVIGLYKS